MCTGNGIYQSVDRHYLESTNSSIYFASALTVGDIINDVIYADGLRWISITNRKSTS